VSGNHGYPLLWTIGAITSLLTAVYMFRLVFMAFHGERRLAPAAPEQAEEEEPTQYASDVVPRTPASPKPPHSHGGGGSHGHGTPHEAPWSMAVPLIVLAIGSVLAGYVGVPHALGGENHIESFLEPSFEPLGHDGGAAAAAEAHEEASAAALADEATELALMGASSGIAFAGIGIAVFFWLRRPDAAAAAARRFSGVHRLLLNKYYVDEMYDAAIVQPIKQLSTGGLWKGLDAGLIDGAVNGLGLTVRAGSSGLRRIQTGSVRAYAASLFLGVVLILGWYLWS
jgi:NADH-quinone oxidoreductase subunit L